MSSSDGFSSPARTGSAVEWRRKHDPKQNLRRFAAVAFQQATEPLLATNFNKQHDFCGDFYSAPLE